MQPIKILFLLLFFFPASAGWSQTQFLLQTDAANRIQLSSGLEPGFVFHVQYDRCGLLPVFQLPSAFFVRGEATFHRSLAENNEWAAGAEVLVWRAGPWNALFRTAFANGRLRTKTYRAEKWEWRNQLAFGLYGQKLGVSVFAAYTHNLGLHLEHSDFYRTYIYPDATDGWFGGVGGYADFGLAGHFLLFRRLDLKVQASTAITSTGRPLTLLPVQAGIGVGWRL